MSVGLRPAGLCGMHLSEGGVVYDACQQNPGWGSHQHMCSIRTVNLSCTISIARSQHNALKVELDSHADTGVGG